MAKMDEAARARLKAAGEARKGRATLRGLDPQGWGPALDDLQEGRLTAAPELEAGNLSNGTILTGNFPGRWTYSRAEAREDRETKPKGIRATTLTHAEMKHARDDQHADLFRWLGELCVPVIAESYAGPNQPFKMAAFFVYPIVPLVRLMWAIWPNGDDWRVKVKKYVHGFTAGIVASSYYPGRPSDYRSDVVQEAVGAASEEWRTAFMANYQGKAISRLTEAGLYGKKPKKAETERV